MAQLMWVVMDGVTYKVRVKSNEPFEESFRIEDGENNMILLNGEESRDVLGTYYDLSLIHIFKLELGWTPQKRLLKTSM